MREEHADTWLVEPLKCKAVGMVAHVRAPLCCNLDVHSGAILWLLRWDIYDLILVAIAGSGIQQ